MKKGSAMLGLLVSLTSFSQCELHTFTVTSNLGGGGPTDIEWELEEQISGDEISSGGYLFSQGNNMLYWEECLAQGCYRLRIDSEEDMTESSLDIIVTDSNGNIVQPSQPTEWDDDRVEFFFSVMNGCSGAGDCMASFNWSQGNNPGEIVLDNTSVSEAAASYAWSWNNGESSSEESPVITFDANGIYEVCLTLTAECIATTCMQVVVNNFPAECPDTLSMAEVECGTWIFLAGSDENEVVQWTINEGSNVQGSVAFTYSFEEPGIYSVCATYETEDCGIIELCDTVEITGCGNNSACPSAIEAEFVSCDELEFEVEDAFPGTVVWNYGDGTEETAGILSGHTYTAAGEYIACAFYTSENCESGIELCVPLIVDDCGTEACSMTLVASSDDNQSFLFNLTTELPGTALHWNFGDGTTSDGGTILTHNYDVNGNYLVCVTSDPTTECPDGNTICVTVIVTGGINAIDEEQKAVLFYPNPAKNIIRFTGIDSDFQLRIIDLAGKEVLNANNVTGSFDVSALASGYYFIELESTNEIYTLMLSKE